MDNKIIPATVQQQLQIEAPVQSLILPTQFTGNLTKTSTTPSVKNCEKWQCINTAPVTVTNFLNGQDGQTIHILGDGNTTVANGAKIKTSTGANVLLAVNKVYTFTRFSGVWVNHV